MVRKQLNLIPRITFLLVLFAESDAKSWSTPHVVVVQVLLLRFDCLSRCLFDIWGVNDNSIFVVLLQKWHILTPIQRMSFQAFHRKFSKWRRVNNFSFGICDSLFRSLSWDRARCIKSRLDEKRGATLLRVCPSQYPPRRTLLFKVDLYRFKY